MVKTSQSELWAQLLAGNKVTMAQKGSGVGLPGQHLEMVAFRNTEVGQDREEKGKTPQHHTSFPMVSAVP